MTAYIYDPVFVSSSLICTLLLLFFFPFHSSLPHPIQSTHWPTQTHKHTYTQIRSYCVWQADLRPAG